LDEVIADCKKAKIPIPKHIREQHRSLMAQMTAALKRERAAAGEPEPEPVVISLKKLRLKAIRKGLSNG
jgi:hypothetical protein